MQNLFHFVNDKNRKQIQLHIWQLSVWPKTLNTHIQILTLIKKYISNFKYIHISVKCKFKQITKQRNQLTNQPLWLCQSHKKWDQLKHWLVLPIDLPALILVINTSADILTYINFSYKLIHSYYMHMWLYAHIKIFKESYIASIYFSFSQISISCRDIVFILSFHYKESLKQSFDLV